MAELFYMDQDGNYVGSFDTEQPDLVQVDSSPAHYLAIRVNGVWVEPIKTAEDYALYVQIHMDNTAISYGYDSIASAVSYADEPAVAKFQTEGTAFRTWRSLVWEYLYTTLEDVEAGTRETPSEEELILELPPLVI